MTLYTLNWNVIFRSKIRQNGLSKNDFLTQCALFILVKEKKEHHAKRNFLNAWISTVAVLNFSVSIWTNLNIYFDFQMSWSTKRRNSRPSLTNSTRPSPRCPATKKIFYPTNFQFPNFFLRKNYFSRFLPTINLNLGILQHYFFVRFSPLPFTFHFKKERNHSLQSR